VFPLKIDDQLKKVPFVTITIIIICCVIHWKRQVLFPLPGLIPLDVVHSVLHYDKALPGMLLTLVTAFFIHGSLLHLAGNVWYLWIFGSALEQKIHRSTYLFFYLLSGVASLVVQIATDPLSSIPVVGASGAIAGVMGMYMVVCPLSRIVFWFPPVFFIPLPAILFCAGWFALQWFNAHAGSAGTSGVAWWAHIGGFIVGVIAGIVVRSTGRCTQRPAGRIKKRSGRH